jgi:NodT family efflux transporter outer membrane factor (OMF) lipoprotein
LIHIESMKIVHCVVMAVVLAAAVWMQGCSVGPDYHTPATTMPSSFVAAPPATQPAPPVDVTQWWKSLDDPELNRLVDRAIAANPDLQIALMRLQQARAEEYAVAGIGLPEIDADGAVGRGTGTDSVKGRIPTLLDGGVNPSGLHEVTEAVGLDGSWELDPFGGLRREAEAARYDTQAAANARNDVLVTLVSDVAAAYVDERATQLRLSITAADAQAELQSYNVVQARYDRGFTNELDPAIAKRELATVQAELAPLNAAIESDRRHLTVLLGRFPGELSAELIQPGGLPELPDRIEPGLPIELLRRRSDIRQAERQLAAATARIGVATDALYPHVFISGALGVQGQGFGRTPLESSFIGSIGPGAYWSLLDFGTLDALVERQDYRTRELLLNYQRTVLSAVEQVDNAINNYAALQDRLRSLSDALNAAQRAVAVASQRYDRGFTNYLDVLDAQRELYALQDQYATTQEAVVLQFVGLYRALGGGWENYQTIPSVRQPAPAIIAIFHHTDAPGDPAK